MKNLKTIIFLVSICVMCMATAVAQKRYVKIYYNDSTSITGKGKLKGDYIKYWSSPKAKPSKFFFDEIEKVIFRHKDGDKTYKSITIKNKENPEVMQVLVSGSLSLYKEITSGSMMIGSPMGGGMGAPMMGRYSITSYYVQRKGERAEHIADNQLFSKNFKKAASEYFKDCPVLVKKIQEREYGKKDLEEIVGFYNENCE